MGDDFYETDYGKNKDCSHNWEREYKTIRDEKNHRDITFRHCMLCNQKQVGLSWNGYQQHGIDWFDEEDEGIQQLLKNIELKEKEVKKKKLKYIKREKR